MTNREWVQQDTDNAVIKMLNNPTCHFCSWHKYELRCSTHPCREGILEWLEAEHIENDEDSE